jgi:flagellar biosynthesis/type III secretory pathway M-ring protein FliF/YscJ
MPAAKSKTYAYIAGGAGLAVVLGIVAVLLLNQRRTRAVVEGSTRALESPAVPATMNTPQPPQLPAQEQIVAANHQLPPVAKKAELVRDRLRESVTSDPALAAGILRSWLEDDSARLREKGA